MNRRYYLLRGPSCFMSMYPADVWEEVVQNVESKNKPADKSAYSDLKQLKIVAQGNWDYISSLLIDSQKSQIKEKSESMLKRAK